MFPLNVREYFCDIVGFKKGFLNLYQHVCVQSISKNAFGLLINKPIQLYLNSFNNDEFLLVMRAPIGKVIMPFTIFDENSYLAIKDVSITPLHLFATNVPDFYECSKIITEDGTHHSLRNITSNDNLYISTFKIVLMVSQSLTISNSDLAAFGNISIDKTIAMPIVRLKECEQFLIGFCYTDDLSGITNAINNQQNLIISEHVESKINKDIIDIVQSDGQTIGGHRQGLILNAQNNSRGESSFKIELPFFDNNRQPNIRNEFGGRSIKLSDVYDAKSKLSNTKNNGQGFESKYISPRQMSQKMPRKRSNTIIQGDLLNKKYVDISYTKQCGLIGFNAINNSSVMASHVVGKNSPIHKLGQPFIGTGGSFESELYSDVKSAFINTCLSLNDLYKGSLDLVNDLWFVHTTQDYTNNFGVKSVLPTIILSSHDSIGVNVTHISSRVEFMSCDCSFKYMPYCDKKQNLPAYILDTKNDGFVMSQKQMIAKNKIVNACKFILFAISF